jgi:hypothetical protein
MDAANFAGGMSKGRLDPAAEALAGGLTARSAITAQMAKPGRSSVLA